MATGGTHRKVLLEGAETAAWVRGQHVDVSQSSGEDTANLEGDFGRGRVGNKRQDDFIAGKKDDSEWDCL